MTSILQINNDVTNRYNALSVESKKFSFEEDHRRFSSVLQYIYYKVSRNHELLWESDPTRLRTMFNRLTNIDYRDTTRSIIDKVVVDAVSKDKDFQRVISVLSEGKRGFYYITNQNNLWGVNEEGYGYNFLGLAYSKSISRMFSSYYALSEDTVSMIYKSVMLLTRHFQNGNDILEFVGRPAPEIYESLAGLYENVVNTPVESVLWESFLHHPNIYTHEQLKWVQLEVDYPCNLAGFIRAHYIRHFNFYLRSRFHRVMIISYFTYVMEKKFSKYTIKDDIPFHVSKLLRKMSTSEHETLANKLFYLYNDPDTTSRLDGFLDYDTRKTLYDIETHFKTFKEIEAIEAFTPFLYHAPKEQSMFIYNTQEEFYDLFEPYTTQLSPYIISLQPRLSIMQSIFTHLISYYGGTPQDKVFETLKIDPLETSYDVFQGILDSVSMTRKRYFTRRAFRIRVEQNSVLNFSVFNTTLFKDDVIVTDPDKVIEETATKELLKIRERLTEPYYPISLYFSDDMYLQDRIRFRLEDFYRVLSAYKKLTSHSLLTESDLNDFESKFYQDPATFFRLNSDKPIKVFEDYFSPIVDQSVRKKLWSFIGNYCREYEKTNIPEVTEENISRKQSLYPIVAHVTNTVLKVLPGATFKVLSEFLTGILNIRSTFPIPPVYTSTFTSTLRGHYDVMKKYLDFSTIPADFGFYLLNFLEWVGREDVPAYRVEFLISVNHIYTPTPLDFSLENALKPFVVAKGTVSKSALSIVTKEKPKASKKEYLKALMEKNKEDIEQETENTEEEEGVSEMLQELGLDDDDTEEEEEEDIDEDDEM